MIHTEFENLKEYQQNRESYSTKFTRRAQKNSPDALSFTKNKCGYRLLAWLVSDESDDLDSEYNTKELRAKFAGELYCLCKKMVTALESGAPTSEKRKILNSILCEINSETLQALPRGQKESTRLKPLANVAVLKVIQLMQDQDPNIFDDPLVEKELLNKFFRSVSEHMTPEMKTLAKRFENYSLTEYANNPDLSPVTISQLAVKLGTIYVLNLELNEHDIASVIQKYLTETGQTSSAITQGFIEALINSDNGTGKETSLKSLLPSNPEAFIRDAIKSFNNTVKPGSKANSSTSR
jgi:hypothetical protein